jgi:uncharacterized protein (DUF2062 family)
MKTQISRLRTLAPSREQLETHPSLRRLAPWLGNPKLWHWSRRGVAAGAAVGLFIGFAIPVAQILLAAVVAVALRVNLPVAAAATLITNPLTVAPIYYGAYHLGAWVTGTQTAAGLSLTSPADLWENLSVIGPPLLAGLGITASLAALISYLLISLAWAWRILAKRRRTGP